jgi:hypothetical protein
MDRSVPSAPSHENLLSSSCGEFAYETGLTRSGKLLFRSVGLPLEWGVSGLGFLYLAFSGRIDQPTALRLNKSMTNARNNQPSSVSMYVMSPVHAWLGPGGVKLRFTRFGAIGRSCRLSVVTTRKRHLPRARMPCFCISRRTRCLPTRTPRLTSSRQIRGQP